MKAIIQSGAKLISVFFVNHVVEIAITVCSVAILAVFISWYLKKKRMLVMESSVYYHEVEELNSRYSFHEDIFDRGCYVYTYEFNTKQRYDRYSLEDVMDILLQDELWTFEKAIKDVDENKKEYERYCAELEGFHSEITEEECKLYKIRYSWYLKTEQKLVEKIVKKPILSIEVDCGKEYTSPAGRNHYEDGRIFDDGEVREMVDAARDYEIKKNSEDYRRRMERNRITAKKRYQVMHRDKFRCQLCGAREEDGVRLHVDHIIPVSKGGTSDMDNLRTLCDRCNLGKGDLIE